MLNHIQTEFDDDHPTRIAEQNDVVTVLAMQLDKLDDRQRDILIKRFGLFGVDPVSLAELARVHGVTRVRIRQIQLAGLRKLRHPNIRHAFLGYIPEEEPVMAEPQKKITYAPHTVSEQGKRSYRRQPLRPEREHAPSITGLDQGSSAIWRLAKAGWEGLKRLFSEWSRPDGRAEGRE